MPAIFIQILKSFSCIFPPGSICFQMKFHFRFYCRTNCGVRISRANFSHCFMYAQRKALKPRGSPTEFPFISRVVCVVLAYLWNRNEKKEHKFRELQMHRPYIPFFIISLRFCKKVHDAAVELFSIDRSVDRPEFQIVANLAESSFQCSIQTQFNGGVMRFYPLFYWSEQMSATYCAVHCALSHYKKGKILMIDIHCDYFVCSICE